MRFTTRIIARLGLLTALAIVLTRFAGIRVPLGGIEAFRVGLGPLPIIMAGIFYGPVSGALVGAVADVAGFVAMPMGPYAPHFTLTAALTGFIPGLVVMLIRRRTLGSLLIAVVAGQMVTAIILVPLFLERLFGMPRAVTIPPRIMAQIVEVPVYVAMLRIAEQRLPRQILWPDGPRRDTR